MPTKEKNTAPEKVRTVPSPRAIGKLLNAKGASERGELVGKPVLAGRVISVIELRNGLRVLLQVNRNAPVVSFHTWFRVGSRHEHEGKTGIAHLFEHLMFNESKNLPAGKFDKLLERAGAQTNAATWNDWTYYYEDVPADQLPLVIKLESERMANLVLRKPQLESEREVVANERRFRVDDDVDGTVNEILYKTAFTAHPYHHPTIGWMSDIEGFTTEDLRAFYKTWYAPNNATIVVVGDFDPDKTLKMIVKHYGAMKRAKLPERAYPDEPAQAEARRVEIRRPTPSARVAIGYKSPGIAHEDHPALAVLAEILFGGRAARVYRELVTRQEIAIELSGSVSSFVDPGLFEIYMTARPDSSADALLAAFDACVAKAVREGVTEAECERAVARMELSTLQGLETVGGVAEQIGFYDVVLGDPTGVMGRLEVMRAVTVPQVCAAATKYLVPTQRTVVLVHPGESETEKNGAAS